MMKLAQADQIILSIWLKSKAFDSINEVNTDTDIDHISLEIIASNTCFSSSQREAKMVAPQNNNVSFIKNKNYLQQSVIAALKNKIMAQIPILPFTKLQSSLAQACAVNRMSISVPSVDDINNTIKISNLRASKVLLTEHSLASKVVSNFSTAVLSKSELDKMLQKSTFNHPAGAAPNRFQFFIQAKTEQQNKQKASVQYKLNDMTLSTGEFCILSNKTTENLTIYSPYSITADQVIIFNENETPHKVASLKPIIRIPLYHIDSEDMQEVADALSKTQKPLSAEIILTSLIGKLDGTEKNTESCDSFCGLQAKTYSVKDLLIAVINARLKEKDQHGQKKLEEWDRGFLDLTADNDLQKILHGTSQACTII